VHASTAAGRWPSWGNGILDQSYAPAETLISPSNVSRLKPAWTFTTRGTPVPTPAIDGDYLYEPDLAGYLYKLRRADGTLVWKHRISEYTGKRISRSRTSPAIGDTALVLGDYGSPTVLGIDKNSGKLLWTADVGKYGGGFVIGSPVIYKNVVYVGVTSFDEVTSLVKGTRGPTFRGSVAAIDVGSGKVLWQTPTQPDGYFGGSIWSSTPVVDPARNSVYVSVGDTYSVPADVAACMNATDDEQRKDSCMSPQSAGDGLIALDMDTGAIKWVRRAIVDTWDIFCGYPTGKPTQGGTPLCPVKGDHFDFDFGSGPNMINANLVGAGEKSGVYHAFNPDTGEIVWSTAAGPSGLEGGIQWGTATDGKRIYVPEADFNRKTYTLADGTQWAGGSWAALDPTTGKILWQTPAPTPAGATREALAQSGVSVANGVVYSGTLSGDFVAMDAATGKILWTFASGGSVHSAPAIVNGVLYWASGYLGLGATTNDKLYAFTVR
jgi:polyvinyl alcohol dehydrogenase (cytochrome)